MNVINWLVFGLAAFDTVLCVVLYLIMRASTELNRSILLPVGAGMTAFVFHAVLFFNGPFLIVQLATIAALFGIVLLEVRRRQIRV
jgi:hypothetical protein